MADRTYLLGFSASLDEGAIVLVSSDGVIASTAIGSRGETSRLIVKKSVEMLDNEGLSLKDIGCYGADIGPGSFTGIRLALSAARAFAWLSSIPTINLYSTDVLARASVEPVGNAKHFAICLDARRRSLYVALYENADSPIRLSGPSLIAVEKLPQILPQDTVVVGAQPPKYDIQWPERLIISTDPHYEPHHFASLLFEALSDGERGDWTALKPLYLRKSEAEELWEKRHPSK